MKTIYKVLLVVGGTIFFSELVHFVPTPAFIQKYIDRMNARSEANINALEKFAANRSNNLPSTLKIFKSDSGLKFNETLNFIHRSPAAKFTYNEKYEIMVYKIDSSFNNSLAKTLKETDANSSPSVNIHFANDDMGYLQLYYNNTNQMLPKSNIIYLNLYGSETRCLLKNDTTVYYYSKMINANIAYDANGPQDIYAKSYADNSPIEVLLLERRNSLYFILMTAKDPKYSLPSNLLYNLTTGSN